MSDQATTKQIAFIHQLQTDWAYLADATKPDFAAEKHAIAPLANKKMREEVISQGGPADISTMNEAEREAHQTRYKARMAEIEAEVTASYVAGREAGWNATITALTASTDDLTKAEATALIGALNG